MTVVCSARNKKRRLLAAPTTAIAGCAVGTDSIRPFFSFARSAPHTNHQLKCAKHILIAQTVKITTVLSLRDPEGVVAISQNHLASCMYSGEYETFLLDCTRRGYAASVTLVPRERLRYHVAALLAMTRKGNLIFHCETGAHTTRKGYALRLISRVAPKSKIVLDIGCPETL